VLSFVFDGWVGYAPRRGEGQSGVVRVDRNVIWVCWTAAMPNALRSSGMFGNERGGERSGIPCFQQHRTKARSGQLSSAQIRELREVDVAFASAAEDG
jgi:hypothetical protein